MLILRRLVVLCVVGVCCSAHAAGKPNLVVLLADDQRFDTIRALGNREIITPNLDALVAGGTAFTRAYLMGGDQPAVCVPSRAMLFTGRTLFRAKDWPVGQAMGETLQRAGYVTHGIGKWHNGAATYARQFSGGANVFFGGMGNQSAVRVQDFDPDGKYPRTRERIGEKFSTELFTDSAVQFLRDYRDEQPFFLYLAYTSPHDPRTAPAPFRARYDETTLTLPKNFQPAHPFDNGELKVRDELLAPFPRTPEVIRTHIADYYAMITHLDAQIGRVLAALKATGRADNTIVVFAGDNGLAVGRHGLMGKQNLYDHSVHVPLVLRGPGVAKAKRTDAMVYLLDLFPTLCDLSGTPTPETVEGRSFAPVLAGRTNGARDSLFFAYRNFQRAVFDGRWKLIRYPQVNRTQLFDLRRDPDELRDQSGDPSQTDRLQTLNARLTKWHQELGDSLKL